jgi:glycine/D-amino acid oxidase-like deaminating enzyme
VHESLVELFPSLGDVRITHSWGGPLGIAHDWHPSVGFDATSGLGWAGGYSVTASRSRTLPAGLLRL